MGVTGLGGEPLHSEGKVVHPQADVVEGCGVYCLVAGGGGVMVRQKVWGR